MFHKLPLLLLLFLVAGCDEGFRKRGKIDVSYCGNGRIDPGETCDDGNGFTEACEWGVRSCTVCDANCQLVPGATSFCGDGRLDGRYESCDDGNAITESCPHGETCDICDSSCQRVTLARYCGDGVVDAGDEDCDDGALNSDAKPDACRANCQPAHCGDGVVDTGELCDPGIDAACRADCTPMRCGDGIHDPNEECDPASGAGDGCRDNCLLPSCGDGLVDSNEDCDAGIYLPVDLAGRRGAICSLGPDGDVRCFGGSSAFRDVPASLAEGAIAVSVGAGWACALDARNQIVCWGEEPVGPAHPVLVPPPGRYYRLAAGDAHACALNGAGQMKCWGRFDSRGSEAETSRYDVVSGRGFACARSMNRTISCWGASSFDVGSPPPGRYKALAAGPTYACALGEDDGTVACWGEARAWQLRLPTRELTALALAADHACGLDATGAMVCWGEGMGELQQLPGGSFDRLASVGDAICGLSRDRIACWGAGAAVLELNANEVPGACRADCSAPRCGDGVIDPGEACDDGNAIDDGNGCSATCERVGFCGDGIIQPAFESCDEGDAVREVCEPGTSCEVCAETCTMEAGITRSCGDSRLDPGETCDDGSTGLRFRSLSMGGNHGCGLLVDGRIRCFGNSLLEDPPQGDFVSVATGGNFACALHAAGSIECWGLLASPTGDPGRRFVALDAGSDGACALDESGALRCWGALAAPPGGTGWQQVSVGQQGACALDATGAIACRGIDVPFDTGGGFTRIAVGADHVCAVDADGYPRCWGGGFAPGDEPRVRAVDLTSGAGQSCVVDRSGMATCFGPAAVAPPTSLFSGISAAGGWACGVREDGFGACWGEDVVALPRNRNHVDASCRVDCLVPTCGDFVRDADEDCDFGIGPSFGAVCDYEEPCLVCSDLCTIVGGYAPYCGDGRVHPGVEACDDGNGLAAEVGTGMDFTCMLSTGGSISCWGRDDLGQSSPLARAYFSMGLGARHGCGLDRSTLAYCWGADDRGQLDAPRLGFRALAAGYDFTCGRTADGHIACWGDVPFTVPAGGGHVAIGAGDRHLCALHADGTIACWGMDDLGQASPPPGAFDAIAIGAKHGCALAGEALVCWGDDSAGQTTPPAGLRFATPIAAGSYGSCAMDAAARTLRCWGEGPAGTPAGEFDQLSLSRWGRYISCARSSGDGAAVCWGELDVPAPTFPRFNDDERPDACRSDCTLARCGDGVVDSGEACDDGNLNDGDGCSGSCTIE